MKDNTELENRIRRAIPVVISFLVMLWTVGMAITNLPYYGRNYGWFCATCIYCYLAIAGALALAISLAYGMSSKSQWFFRCLEVSSALYFIAALIALIDNEVKSDFYPILMLPAIFVFGIRMSRSATLMRSIKQLLSPVTLNKPNPAQERKLNMATISTLWIGVGNLIIAVLGLIKVLAVDNGVLIASLIVGCFFIFLWYHVKRMNEAALWTAVILTVVIIIQNTAWVVRVISAGAVPLNLGGIALTVVLLIWLIQGLRTMKRLKPQRIRDTDKIKNNKIKTQPLNPADRKKRGG